MANRDNSTGISTSVRTKDTIGYGRAERRPVNLLGLERILLVIVLLELLLGGNGYLTEVGGVRVRVLLAAICFAWVTLRLISRSPTTLPRQVWVLLFLFVGVTAFGILVGLANGNRPEFILAELKPLMYFPMLLFFAIAIRDSTDVALVTKLIVVCGLIQAIVYLTLLALMHSGIISYSSVYLVLRESDEFIFRHNPENEFFLGFFYKGAFHLAIAGLFLLMDPVRKNLWLAALLFVAVGLTLTRGLIAALILSLVVGVFLMPKRKWVIILFSVAVPLTVVPLATGLIDVLRRPESDEIRLMDFETIRQEVDWVMLLIGRGMGAMIGERDRIEMTYLEILYKQGLIGLSFWMALFYTNYAAYRRVKWPWRQRALAFQLSATYVYLSTATNTFLTGSIGMSIVLISTVVLLVLGKQSESLSVAQRSDDHDKPEIGCVSPAGRRT